MAETPLPRIGGGVDLSALQHQHEHPASPGNGTGEPSVIEVTPENLQSAVVDASSQHPILLAVYDPGAPSTKQLLEILHSALVEHSDKIAMGTVDARAYPEIAQAMQVQQLPVTVAALKGQLLPLFAGIPEPAQVSQLLAQVLQAAAQAGVTGKVQVSSSSPDEQTEPEPVLTPTQQRAYAAMEAADWEVAVSEFSKAIEENPRDAKSERALAQAKLMFRTEHPDADEALAEADAKFNSGDENSAMQALLAKLGTVFGDDRAPYQHRLVEYFTLIGVDDPRVVAARRQLAQLLY